MNWSDVGNAVGKAVPLLGGLLFGPAGVAVGGIVSAALGTNNNPEDVMKAINTDPEAMVKLRQAEMDNQVQLTGLAVEAEKNRLAAATNDLTIAAQDRQSARQFASTGDHTARNLAYMYTGMLFFTLSSHIVLMVWKVQMDPLALQVIGTLEGVLISVALGAKEFFFGSSVSEQKKSDTIEQIAKS